MPIFTYKCPDHGEFKKYLDKRLKVLYCDKCGKESKSIVKIGSITVMERLDNGAMARAVERPHNIEELIDERNSKWEEQQFKPPEESED